MAWNSKKFNRRKSQVAQIEKCPDGGWGWVIVLTSVISLSNFSLVQRCYSVFYTYLMKEFDAEFSEVAWINGLFQAGYGIACPLTPGLINLFSYRQVTMTASLISSISIAIASCQNSLIGVLIFAGLIPGLCMGPIMISCFTVSSRYFDKKRNLAIQILCGGLTIGGFFYCPTIQFLIDTYTWKGALLVIAGFYLQSGIAGAAMRPIILEEDFDPMFLNLVTQPSRKNTEILEIDLNNNDDNNNNNCEESEWIESDDVISNEKKYAQQEFNKEKRNEIRTPSIESSEEDYPEGFSPYNIDEEDASCNGRMSKLVKKLHLEVFGMPLFYLYTFSYITYAAGYFSCLNYLVPYGKQIGLGDMESSTLISAVMVGEILTRSVTGFFLGNVTKQGRVLYMACYIGMLTFSFIFASVAKSYKVMLVACSTMGFFGGAMDGLFSVFMGDAFGMKLYPAVFGYGNILIHLCGMASTIAVGKLLDAVGDLSVAFYVGMGTCVLASAITFLMRHVLIKKVVLKEKKSAKNLGENIA